MEFIQNCIREAEWELGLEAHTEINKIGSGKNDRMECHIKEIMFHLGKKKKPRMYVRESYEKDSIFGASHKGPRCLTKKSLDLIFYGWPKTARNFSPLFWRGRFKIRVSMLGGYNTWCKVGLQGELGHSKWEWWEKKGGREGIEMYFQNW